MRYVVATILLLLSCRENGAPQVEVRGESLQQVRAVIALNERRWIDFRHDLHRHPELSGAESRTSALVATEMRRLGLSVRTNVGGYGVVAILRGARPGPLIAYRADMDAVASSARDPIDYASLTSGVRHICGHDIHTTVAIALATALHQVRDSLAGSVMFLFQPAEERATGAKAMLADGVFANERPVEIYGLHTAGYEQGRLATTAGPMMAGRDRFEVVLSGGGDLRGATSAITAAINALATVVAPQPGAPQPPDFVMIQLNAPSESVGEVRLTGNVSVASASSRARVASTIRRGLVNALPPGVTLSSTYEEKWIAGVTNDSTRALAAAAIVRATLGDAAVSTVTTIPAGFSEDFGSFQELIPGVFFYLGVANASQGWNGLPHSPDYVADDRAIGVGALAMAAVLVDRLRIR